MEAFALVPRNRGKGQPRPALVVDHLAGEHRCRFAFRRLRQQNLTPRLINLKLKLMRTKGLAQRLNEFTQSRFERDPLAVARPKPRRSLSLFVVPLGLTHASEALTTSLFTAVLLRPFRSLLISFKRLPLGFSSRFIVSTWPIN